mgnify:CR=1 FL=1
MPRPCLALLFLLPLVAVTALGADDDCECFGSFKSLAAERAALPAIYDQIIGLSSAHSAGYHRARLAALEARAGEWAAADAEQAADESKHDRNTLREILALLRARTAHDFRHYKKATVLRRIEREIATQLDRGMSADRLHHRLTARFAGFSPSEIRDPGRWLLGVALPRWGCGHVDCESGVMWSTGRSCDVCDEVKAANAARRERERLIADGRCPDHGHRLRPSGICPVCELDRDVHQHRRRPTNRCR